MYRSAEVLNFIVKEEELILKDTSKDLYWYIAVIKMTKTFFASRVKIIF